MVPVESNNPENNSQTTVLNEHKLGSFALSCQAPEKYQHYFKPCVYTGAYAGQFFIQKLLEFQNKITHLYRTEYGLPMLALSPAQEKLHQETDICHICNEKITCELSLSEWMDTMASRVFTSDDRDRERCLAEETDFLGPRVYDHCHNTGQYRGVAHSKCNLLYHPLKAKIPCYFHAV